MNDAVKRISHAQRLQALGAQYASFIHDLNNLLTIARGYVSLARSEIDPAHSSQRMLELAEAAAAEATSLSKRVLDFSRPRVLSYLPIDVGTAVRDGVALLQSILPDGIRVEVETQPNIPRIAGDRIELQQIVTNLCLNAAEAIIGSHGAIRVRIERASIEEGEFVCMKVIDWGRGMNEVTRARMFEAFFTTKEPAEGIGLGLTIVRDLVAAHGGRIAVKSAQGVGTEIEVLFPAVASVAD